MTAIIGVDPGLTTGISWGIFSEGLRDRTSNWNALIKGRATGCRQIGPKDPYKDQRPRDAHEGALLVAQAVVDLIFNFHVERGIPIGQIIIACEHFEVRGVPTGATSQTGLSPVFIAGVLYGILIPMGYGSQIHWVRASQHKGYATDDRIKRVGKATKGRIGWTRGRPHTRDSWRIVAYELNSLA